MGALIKKPAHSSTSNRCSKMGARNNSMPKRDKETTEQVKRRKSMESTNIVNAQTEILSLAPIIELTDEFNGQTSSRIRDEVYSMAYNKEKNVSEARAQQSFYNTTKSHHKITPKQVFATTSTQSLVQGNCQMKTEINEETKHSATKQEKGQIPPAMVNQISMIQLQENPNKSTFSGKIGKVDVTLLVDTGSVVTCISDEVWQKLKDNHPLLPCKRSMVLESVNGQPLELVGETEIKFQIENNYFSYTALIVRNLS